MRHHGWLVVVGLVFLGACGGSSDGGGSASTSPPSESSGGSSTTTDGGGGAASGDPVAYAVDGVGLVRLTPADEGVDYVAEGPYGGYLGVIDGDIWNANLNTLTHFDGDGDVLGVIDLEEPGYDFAGGEGAVWVIAGIPGVNTTVYKIDPVSNEVVAETDSPEGTWFGDIAVGGGSVWVIGGSVESVAVITRLDPVTLDVVGAIETEMVPDNLVFHEGELWVGGTAFDPTRPEIALSRISSSGDLLGTIRLGDDGAASVAAGLGSIWLSNSSSAELIRIDPGSEAEVARIAVGDGSAIAYPVFVSGGSVWVVNDAERRVFEIDPETNEIVGGFDNPSISIGFVD